MMSPAPAAAFGGSRCPARILEGLASSLLGCNDDGNGGGNGDALVERIRSCRILLVGAGGIGCELLKNLALTGFRRVDVIDLDTIDVSK